MPPEDAPAEWRPGCPGCPDCAELREELATARAEMRAAVVAYEARLREEIARYAALLSMIETLYRATHATVPPPRAAFDPMDAFTPPTDDGEG